MYLFSKHFIPQNFAFSDKQEGESIMIDGTPFALRSQRIAPDVFHVSLSQARWGDFVPVSNSAGEKLATQNPLSDATCLEWRDDASLALMAQGPRGIKAFLSSLPGASFGVSGQSWMFQFRRRPDMQFYGLGEKSTPFEKSDRTHRFWNTDVWSDHGVSRAKDQAYDPDYISVPYLIIKRGNTYAGILIDNPHPSVIAVVPKLNVANQMMAMENDAPYFFLGAEDGPPSLYFLFGPSLAELTVRMQKLTGLAALPPLWSLGYQQSRWGYQGTADLQRLADGFDKHRFPCDGLWLDIDYMHGYRVFTYAPEHFQDPQADMRAIQARGYRVVPILDPGVKREPGYDVYDDGKADDIFCKNPAGCDFTGVVWPGYTVFPDFSLAEGRAWWAKWVQEISATGPDGFWLDMNDPSTGMVDCMAMLFQHGKAQHGDYHNLYASLMAQATRDGLLAQNPQRRPFLLSRSGFTGSQRFTAHWTGDNWSNYHHLHMSIGKSLNLALSGMAINGPDVPGFGGNATPELFIDWIKAGCLFPFLRNHSMRTFHPQEPWVFPKPALRVARHFVRLRYKLLPYLYNLVIRHCEEGDAILRPLFHDFRDTRKFPLGHIQDQFLVGPALMQAPFTVEDQNEREIILPDALWWRADEPGWVAGPARLRARKDPATTPIFLRQGSFLPMQTGVRSDNRKELRRIELLIVLSAGSDSTAIGEYVCDDGDSFAYRDGARSRYRLEAEAAHGNLCVTVTPLSTGFGEVEFLPVTVDRFSGLTLRGPAGERALRAKAVRDRSFGAQAVWFHWS